MGLRTIVVVERASSTTITIGQKRSRGNSHGVDLLYPHPHQRVLPRALPQQQVPPREHHLATHHALLHAQLRPIHRKSTLLEKPLRRALRRRELRRDEEIRRIHSLRR